MNFPDDSPDEFQVNIGNLPAGKQCIIVLYYSTQLTPSPDGFLLTLPLTKAPIAVGKDSDVVRNGIKIELEMDLLEEIEGIFFSILKLRLGRNHE